jgi:hypothetical protein
LYSNIDKKKTADFSAVTISAKVLHFGVAAPTDFPHCLEFRAQQQLF